MKDLDNQRSTQCVMKSPTANKVQMDAPHIPRENTNGKVEPLNVACPTLLDPQCDKKLLHDAKGRF